MTTPIPELRDAAEALIETVDQVLRNACEGQPVSRAECIAAHDALVALVSNPAPSGGGWESDLGLVRLFLKNIYERSPTITAQAAHEAAQRLAALSPVQPAGTKDTTL